MGTVISVFNHKGGVGKTTLVHNIGVAMAQQGHNVLFIDADPQMNLTAAYHGLSDKVQYGDDDKISAVDTIKSQWAEAIAKPSIFDVIGNCMKGNPVNMRELDWTYQAENSGQVGLLQGSVKLASLEADMHLAISTRRDIQAAQIIRVQQYLRELSQKYDVIFIDTPPSAGSSVTSVLVRSSDYLITPVSPTFFSLQAIDNLQSIFTNWNKEFDWIDGFDYRVKFLGSVVQMVKRYAGGANQSDFSATTDQWVTTLNDRTKPFQQWMLGTGHSVSEDGFNAIFPNCTPFIAEVCCDFTAQLRGIAERAGVAIINLTQDLCVQYKPATSAVDITKAGGQYKLSFDKISEQYKRLANNLAQLL